MLIDNSVELARRRLGVLHTPKISSRAQRIVMLLRGTRPHENERHGEYPGPDSPAPGARPSCLWCPMPENESGPTSARLATTVEPDPVAPAHAGSTQSKLLHAPRSLPRRRRPQPEDPDGLLHAHCAGLDV